jgi:hypothetical protein
MAIPPVFGTMCATVHYHARNAHAITFMDKCGKSVAQRGFGRNFAPIAAHFPRLFHMPLCNSIVSILTII